MKPFIPFFFISVAAVGIYYYLIKTGRLTPLRKATLLISVFAFTLTEIGRSFYRPYIYANKINDFFIADTIGNSLGTVTAIFFLLTIVGKENSKDYYLIFIVTVGLILYEGFNIFSNHPVDINDIISTILFGFVSALIYWRLLKRKA